MDDTRACGRWGDRSGNWGRRSGSPQFDHKLAHCTPEEAAAAAGRLRAVQEEIANMTPPSAAFMGELYDLKQHIEWLLGHAEADAAAAPAAHSPR